MAKTLLRNFPSISKDDWFVVVTKNRDKSIDIFKFDNKKAFGEFYNIGPDGDYSTLREWGEYADHIEYAEAAATKQQFLAICGN